jgi:hypothetical protein
MAAPLGIINPYADLIMAGHIFATRPVAKKADVLALIFK